MAEEKLLISCSTKHRHLPWVGADIKKFMINSNEFEMYYYSLVFMVLSLVFGMIGFLLMQNTGTGEILRFLSILFGSVSLISIVVNGLKNK